MQNPQKNPKQDRTKPKHFLPFLTEKWMMKTLFKLHTHRQKKKKLEKGNSSTLAVFPKHYFCSKQKYINPFAKKAESKFRLSMKFSTNSSFLGNKTQPNQPKTPNKNNKTTKTTKCSNQPKKTPTRLLTIPSTLCYNT